MSVAQDFLNAIPDGGSIGWTAFVAKAGQVANFFSFASPQQLSRTGDDVTVP